MFFEFQSSQKVQVPGLRTIYASPVAAGGHVYLTGRSGTTVVLKDTETFEIVATNTVGEGVDTTPAPIDNELFIRGEQHLFCIAEGTGTILADQAIDAR